MNIFLGQKICVCTDYKKIAYKVYNSARVICWRLLIEEFGPELHYLPGKINVVSDCISRLKYDKDDITSDHFELKKEDINKYLLSYKIILKYQQKDKVLLKKAKNDKTYAICTFTTAGRTCILLTKNKKIVIPLALQETIVH